MQLISAQEFGERVGFGSTINIALEKKFKSDLRTDEKWREFFIKEGYLKAVEIINSEEEEIAQDQSVKKQVPKKGNK